MTPESMRVLLGIYLIMMRNHKKLLIKTPLVLLSGVAWYVLIFFVLSVLRYKAFFSYEWEDVSAIYQLCWQISRGNIGPYVQGIILRDGEHLFHIMPIYFLVSLFYIVSPHIYTTFFLVAVCLGVAAIPIYFIAFRVFQNKSAALSLAMAYLLYAPKNSLNFLDGDSSIYVIPLLLYAFYSVLVGRRIWFVVFSALVMLCKTETPLYVAVLGLYLFIKRREFNKISPRMFLIVGGVAAFVFALNIYLFDLWTDDSICYSCREPSFWRSMWFVVSHPTLSFLSEAQTQSLAKLFMPVLFFPVFTFEMLLGLPSLLFVVIADHFVYQRAHYISALIPALFIGTIYFIKKLQLRFKMKSPVVLAAAVLGGCLVSNFTDNIIGGPYPISEGIVEDTRFIDAKNIYAIRFYVMDAEDKIAWRMINMIPKDPDVAVAASGDLLIPLSSRKKILQFLDKGYDYRDVDYILIHNRSMYMGAGHYEWDKERAQEEIGLLLADRNWDLIAQEGTFYLFKKRAQ